MENKKLNEQELEEVNGGQAVLPLKGNEVPESDGTTPVGVAGKIKICPNCGEIVTCPSVHGGTVKCNNCGEYVHF